MQQPAHELHAPPGKKENIILTRTTRSAMTQHQTSRPQPLCPGVVGSQVGRMEGGERGRGGEAGMEEGKEIVGRKRKVRREPEREREASGGSEGEFRNSFP